MEVDAFGGWSFWTEGDTHFLFRTLEHIGYQSKNKDILVHNAKLLKQHFEETWTDPNLQLVEPEHKKFYLGQDGVLARSMWHKRDAHIFFNEPEHKYMILLFDKQNPAGGQRLYIHETISITTLIHTFFEHFDEDVAIAKLSPRHPLFGQDPAFIKAQWEANRVDAAERGTRMHANIETYYETTYFAPHTKRILRNASFWNMPTILADLIFEYMGPWEIDDLSSEFQMFLDFDRDIIQGKGSTAWRDKYMHGNRDPIHPLRVEWRLWDSALQVSGTIDFIGWQVDHTTGRIYLIIFDWKRSKEIKMSNKWQRGLGPLAHLDDCNFNHYSIQLPMYQWFIENRYGFEVRYRFLGVFHPNQATYQVLPVENNRKEVVAILKSRARDLRLLKAKEQQKQFLQGKQPETNPIPKRARLE